MASIANELSETTPLPELSFDDLLDDSPIKSGRNDNEIERQSIENEILSDNNDYDESKDNCNVDETLNTPRTKKQSTSFRKETTTMTNTDLLHADASVGIDLPSDSLMLTIDQQRTESELDDQINEIIEAKESQPVKASSVCPKVVMQTIHNDGAVVSAINNLACITTIMNTTTNTSTNSTTSLATATASVSTSGFANGQNNILQKIGTKIIPKLSVASSLPLSSSGITIDTKANTTNATPGVSTVTTSSNIIVASGNKTQAKMANGKIFYIQKASSLLGGSVSGNTIRLQTTSKVSLAGGSGAIVSPSSSITTSAPAVLNIAKTSIAAKPSITSSVSSANIGAPKKLAIQVVRAADGKLIPLRAKTPTTTTSSTAGSPTSTAGGHIVKPISGTISNGNKATLTLSPTIAAQLVNKKIITTAGQVGQVVMSAGNSVGSCTLLSKHATTSVGSTVPTSPITPKTTSIAIAASNITSAKPVKIQKIMPSITTSLATVSNSSPSSTSGTLNVKTTLTLASAASASPTASVSTTPTSSTSAATKIGNKIIVNGKQIFTTGSKLITLSPKATTTTSATAAVSGQLHAIQIPGKTGLQYVRVLPSSAKLMTQSTPVVTTTGSQVLKTVANNSQADTPTLASSATKASVTVSSASSTNKIILTQSPVKKVSITAPNTPNSPNTPTTSKVQKTLLTIPTMRTINNIANDGQSPPATIKATSTLPTSGQTQILINKSALVRKTKISEINSKLQRIVTSGSPTMSTGNNDKLAGQKRPAIVEGTLPSGKRIVVVPRSAIRNGSSIMPANGQSVGQSPVQQRFVALTPQQSQATANTMLLEGKATLLPKSIATSDLKSVIFENKAKLIHTTPQQQQQNIKLPVQLQQQPHLRQLQENIKTQRDTQKSQQIHHQQQQARKQILNANSNVKPPNQLTSSNGNTSNSNNNSNSNSNSNLPAGASTALSMQNSQNEMKYTKLKIKDEPYPYEEDNNMITHSIFTDDNSSVAGVIRRKHCNCSKSQCLKLYCDCFANGEFCQDCTCKDCFNNLQYEDERQRAIKSCLERNPSAFKPKITSSDKSDTRLHNKGCNCKRSGCLKNYCECFEAKIPCSSNCKCLGCRNVEDRPDLDMDPIDSVILESMVKGESIKYATNQLSMGTSGGSGSKVSQISVSMASKRKAEKKDSKWSDGGSTTGNRNKQMLTNICDSLYSAALSGLDADAGGGGGGDGATAIGVGDQGLNETSAAKQSCNFITQDVVDATVQCMISQAGECSRNGLHEQQIERLVMEELGRCLVEIIDFSIQNNNDSSIMQD